jgi:2,4-dienoyl-CoA reductase-like NADH-dependent reductase (Old Yellow Enzyme family)
VGICDDKLIPGLRRLTDAVHKAGELIMAHINHGDRVVNPKLVLEGKRISSWAVHCGANGVLPHTSDLNELPTYVNYFGEAAHRVKGAGFDAIENLFSHG